MRRGRGRLGLPPLCACPHRAPRRRSGRPRHLVDLLGIGEVAVDCSAHDGSDVDPWPARSRAPHLALVPQALEHVAE
eukprot:4936668-Pleurochrysis_carterae.AAC.1